jgi:hypothetical protein
MSRFYGMSVEITDFPPDAIDRIKQAARGEWPFEQWNGAVKPGGISAYAEERLCGGESEEMFTERLAVAVWRAAGAFCRVSVDATYLEDLPYETHSLDEDDYARLLEG